MDHSIVSKLRKEFDKKNQRRCELIQKVEEGTITPVESEELQTLEKHAADYIKKRYPDLTAARQEVQNALTQKIKELQAEPNE